MGMSYTGFGAPVTTKNLQANADLNLGNYDLIATDVKGDTAEFDEFIGGVGNFTNVLGSGNLDIEGTGNVKGLTTFQDGVQVNGSLHVEGNINNVNIADNGEITTAQGVNGADFNGAKITSTKFNGATITSNGDITANKYNVSVTTTNTAVIIGTETLSQTYSNLSVSVPGNAYGIEYVYGTVTIPVSTIKKPSQLDFDTNTSTTFTISFDFTKQHKYDYLRIYFDGTKIYDSTNSYTKEGSVSVTRTGNPRTTHTLKITALSDANTSAATCTISNLKVSMPTVTYYLA